MLIRDFLYGTFEIDEEVIVELLKSYPLQRLKGVSQGGLPKGTKTSLPNYSRYEHSVGVMLLLRRSKAEVEEQIAGLVHDVSHTAFSHVIDWLLGDPESESYQDSTLSSYIRKSEIADIIKRHGYNLDEISELEFNHRYRLLERDIPDLCADRIDYSLRDGYLMNKLDTKAVLAHLEVYKGEFAFNDMESAMLFCRSYLKCQDNFWAGSEARTRYYILSRALKKALDHNIINLDDLYKSEEEIISTIKNSNDKEVIERLEKAMGDLKTKRNGNETVILAKKLRYVDPKIHTNGEMRRLSELSSEYKELIEDEKRRSKEGVKVESEE